MPPKKKLLESPNYQAMARASQRANAYYYGAGLGDSVEHRFNNFNSFLGGGNDIYDGLTGLGSYPAAGYGNYFGTGLAPGTRYGSGPLGIGPQAGGVGGGFKYLRRFSSNASFNHSLIASCILAYIGYGVIRNIVDLYADFATEGLEIVHPDESVKNFYNAWMKRIDLKGRTHRIFSDLFITGNVFVHRRWAKLSDEDKRILRRSKGVINLGDKLLVRTKSGDKIVTLTEDNLNHYMRLFKELNYDKVEALVSDPLQEGIPLNNQKLLPWGYTSLNPLQMETRGNRFRNENYWIMALDKRDLGEISKSLISSFQDLSQTKINIPEEFKSRISAYTGATKGYLAEVKLDEEELIIIQDRKFDYWDWAVPFIFPALKALSFKDCLRNMEIKACESVINSIFLFKLGDRANGFEPDENAYERLADILQVPGQALNLIWNEAIDAQILQPDISRIMDPKKHESADRDILTALGVPDVLLGGKGSNFSNSFISVATILERLESARDKLTTFLYTELKIIADAMGFRRTPDIKFGRTSLTDKNSERNFIMALWDRGILSDDTILSEVDTNSEVEASKQIKERSLREKSGMGVLEHRSPYLKPEEQVKLGVTPIGWEDVEVKPPAPTTPGGGSNKKPKTPNGRPPGKKDSSTRGPQTNKRLPKGQNLASILDLYEKLSAQGREMLDSLEERIQSKAIRAKGLRYIKQFPQEEKERLEGLIFNVFSHAPAPKPTNFDTDDYLYHLLSNDNITSSVKAEVLAAYHKKLAEYEDMFGKQPNREHRRQAMVSAWTQHAIENIYF